MTGRQRRRLMAALTVLLGASAAVALTITAFQQNMLFFYTPSQIVSDNGELSLGQNNNAVLFRLGGLVEKVWRQQGDLEVRFTVTDTVHAITVSYTGLLPDLFREGQGVVVRGQWQNNLLVADEVLAKHDENYMPPEAADALRAAQTLQDNPAANY